LHTMPAAATVESNAALYTTWDEEWRGRSEYRTERAPPEMRSKASTRLIDEYTRARDMANAANGDREAASRMEGEAIGQHTEDVLEAAEAAIEQNVFDEAIDVITNAIEDGDTTPVLYHLRGRAWLKMGQPQKALDDLNTCLLAEPWFPEAYVERGFCYQTMHDFPNAVAEFVKATKIMENPDASLFFEIGDCSTHFDNEAAATFFAKAIELSPSYALAYWRLADVKAALGDEVGAAESYAMVCRMDSQVSLRYLRIAEEDAEAGKYEEACRTLDAVEKISPQDFRVFWQRANCRMMLPEEDYHGAWADLKKCIELDPVREIEVYIKRGRCAMRLEDYNAAREDAEYYLMELERQEGTGPASPGPDGEKKADSAFEGRLLRAHLYMLEAGTGSGTEGVTSAQDLDGDGIVTEAEAARSRKRATMDYDYVVNTYNPSVDTVRKIYPEAHYCVARLIPHSPEFMDSVELAKEATDRFLKAWDLGVKEPLRHCVEMVVAEKRLKDIRDEEAKAARGEEAANEEPMGPQSLRSMCAAKLVQKGKYGGKSMPGHFHVLLAQMLAKGQLPEGAEPPTQAEWTRCARHMTLGWKNGAQMEKHAALGALTVHMGRASKGAEGGYPSLCSLAVSAIAGDDESFPATMEFMGQLREVVGDGGGKKKK